ncbi:MAG: hypothetical protein F4Y04_05635 [Chloroflexi bacterium]|nr:hypothetical protein [Chloroflexota bacterium]
MPSSSSRSWDDLVGLLGEEAALRVVAACGGEQVCVPQKADPDHRLAAAIGDPGLFAEMAWRWGGCQIYVPARSTALRCVRDKRIRRRAADGIALRHIAHDEGLSVRQVRNILEGFKRCATSLTG